MAMKKVTAIIRTDMLEAIERFLQDMQVPGMSVTSVRGYGEYRDYFSPNTSTEHARIEIFADEDEADKIAQAIMENGRTGAPGDGIVVVLPVERANRIRDGEIVGTPSVPSPPNAQTGASETLPGTTPPNVAWTGLSYVLLLLGFACIGALLVVGTQHRLHALVAALAAVLLVTGLLGLPIWRRGGRNHTLR